MYEMKMEAATDGRSENLTAEERKDFKKLVSDFPTMVSASKALNMSKNTIERIMLVGSGNPNTVEKIRTALKAKNVA